MDELQCKEDVYTGPWSRRSQCARKAVRDGFCKQHHPDSVAARRAESEERYKKKRAAFNAPYDKIKEQEALLSELVGALEAVDKLWTGDAATVKDLYEFEMETMSPVGEVWQMVRAALQKARGV